MKKKIRTRFIPLMIIGFLLIFTSNCTKDKDENENFSMKDGDGNVYTSDSIGTQVWMIENLKTTKYNDGTDIPLVTDSAEWVEVGTPAYCWYNNDSASYKGTYGALYNWYAVNTNKLCPTGYHVPSDAEWHQLVLFCDTNAVQLTSGTESFFAGGKLKETGTTHWLSPNTGATNETGFTALPGGERDNGGEFYDIGNIGYWWSTTTGDFPEGAFFRDMFYNAADVLKNEDFKRCGYSIRCVKD